MNALDPTSGRRGHHPLRPVAGLEAPARLQGQGVVRRPGPNVYVRALTVEPQARALWVGTSAGVHEVDLGSGKLRNTFTRKEGLANEYVFAVGIDRDGNKWFGTNAGGVSRYKDGKWKTFFPMHGLADYWIYSFAQQKNGDFWIGTWAGVNKLSTRRRQVQDLREGTGQRVGLRHRRRRAGPRLVRHRRRRVDVRRPQVEIVDPQGRAGRPQQRQPARQHQHRPGHALAARPVGEHRRPRHLQPQLRVLDPARGRRQHLGRHLGRRRGALGRQGLEQPQDARRARGNIVYSVAQDHEGGIWFGTNNGVSRYDGKRFKTLGMKEGLLERNVYAIAVAPDGDVWVGTRKGVARIAQVGSREADDETHHGVQLQGGAGLVAVGIGAALAGAYQMGRSSGADGCAAGGAAARTSRRPAPHGRCRPVGAAGRGAREGKLAPDPSQKFTHFRVGNKNVKRIYVDGDTVWVGTSGGAVRYDTRSDEYKLFDVKSGLLSNGVFHVGKIDGRIVIGTYGGGMLLLDPRRRRRGDPQHPRGPGRRLRLRRAQGEERRHLDRHLVRREPRARRRPEGPLEVELHTVESTKGGLPNDWVYGLAEGRNGDIWLGTEGGLALFQEGKWQNWNHAKGWARPMNASRTTSSTATTRCPRCRSTTPSRSRRWGSRTSTSPTTPTTSSRWSSTPTAWSGRAPGAAGCRATTASLGRPTR